MPRSVYSTENKVRSEKQNYFLISASVVGEQLISGESTIPQRTV